MRFQAPRSTSPSPVRGKARSSSTFGLQSDSDSEDYLSELESSFDSDSEADVASIASSSSASGSTFDLVSDINKLSLRPRHITRTPLEERQIEETISAIRLRTRYHDLYEEWEHQIRKDAFKAARKEFSERQEEHLSRQEQHQRRLQEHQAAFASKQAADINKRLEELRLEMQESEKTMKQKWKARETALWDRIEAVIKEEESKLAKKLEEERKAKEEEERKRKEEELKRRLLEEKKLKEETERLKAEEEKKRKEEEKAKEEKEAMERKKKLEEEKQKENDSLTELRSKLMLAPADDDWRVARTNLCNLKSGSVKIVKAHKSTKSEWLRLRRLIVVRIGQLTNDTESITRITRDLLEIMRPSNAQRHPDIIYVTLCSSLAKAILLQAETEVSAEPHSAEPLSRVTYSLIENLENFAPIFFAKLVQRCGGWPIPFVVPPHDVDESPWPSNEEFTKVSGWRKSVDEGTESSKVRSARISALMRVYFGVMKIRPEKQPLDAMYQLPRFWMWFARLTSDVKLLEDPVAPWLIYTGLDVLGLEACSVWGKQWAKMLTLIHEGVTSGIGNNKLIGGDSTESALGRARILFVLGNIVNGVHSS